MDSSKRNQFIQAIEIVELLPEDQKRMYNGLRAGKTVYEIMTVDELPQFLAMYPKRLLTFIPWFIRRYISFGLDLLRLGMRNFFNKHI